MENETWPEFVTEESGSPRRGGATAQLTGWETVVFEVTDDQDVGFDGGGSVFVTAAIAP